MATSSNIFVIWPIKYSTWPLNLSCLSITLFVVSACVQDSLDSVEALIKKHGDFEKSMEPQGEKLNTLEQFAQKLINEGHYESTAVASRRDAVLQR